MSKDNQGWTTREEVSYDGMLDENGEIKGPQPLDEGVYYGSIVSAEAVKSAKGNPCIKVVFEVERDYAGNKPPQGRLLKAYSTIPCQANTAFRVLQIAKVFGLDAPTVYGYDEISSFADSLVDKGCYVRMTQREWGSRSMNNLDRFLDEKKAAEEAGDDATQDTSTQSSSRKSRRAA